MKPLAALVLPALLLSWTVAGPARADDDVVAGFRAQVQGQRVTAQDGASSMKAAGGISDIEAAIRREFPPTETPESLKSYENELMRKAVKQEKQRKGELPPDPVATAPAASYVPPPDPTPAQLGAALAKLPPEFADTKGCDAAHQSCKVVRLAKQWSGGVRNQGQAGSCATFASIAALEAAYMREYGATIDFSKMWVIRALVGENLSDAGMGLIRQRGDVKTYLGTYPDDLLSMVSKHGMCQESAFPYNSYVAEGSDSFQGSSWFKRSADKAYAKALTRFAKDYKLADDPKLAKAVAESADFKDRLAGFRSGSLESGSTADIRRFINFGIPLFVGLYPTGGNRMGLMGGHAVVLAGYDLGMRSYIIRNSWGFAGVASVPSLISFDEKRSGIALSDLAFIVGPKDIARACDDKDAAPRELLTFCR